MAKEVWAQNAVIVEQNGDSVRFRPRCPNCGHVQTNGTMGGQASYGGTHYTTFCSECRKQIDIVIRRE